jgi:glycosyltransferase involved in cell wall biosynthesis
MTLLKQINPDLIHVQGLDMLKIACTYKRRVNRNVRIIYEVADLHRLLVDKQKSPVKKMVQWYLRREDRRLKDRYDLLILTSEKYYEVYFQTLVEPERMLYMPNVPDLSAFHSYEKKAENEPFTLGYIGAIRYKKQMINLIQAAKATGVHLLIAGYEDAPAVIEPMCAQDPSITWVGRFDFAAQAAALYGQCDAMYSVYDADMHNVRVALPNKLYEAVYCEMPLIVAKDTYLAEVVDQWGVGFAVDHRQPQELIALLEQLRDQRIPLEPIVENCRKRKMDIDLAVYNQKLKAWLNKLLTLSVG